MNTSTFLKLHETSDLHNTYVDIESRTINQKCALKRIQKKDETDCITNSSEYLQ